MADLQCDFLHSQLPLGGEISVLPTSHSPVGPRNHSEWEILSLVHEAALRSIRSNFFGYPTDCPSREKRGV